MANIYEFGINRGIVEELVKDLRLSLGSDAKGNIVDNLMGIVDSPSTFQKASMDGKPGLLCQGRASKNRKVYRSRTTCFFPFRFGRILRYS